MNERGKLTLATLGVLAVAVLAVACGGGGAEKSTVAEDSEGGKIYKAKCAVCHGGAGVERPMSMGARQLTDPDWQAQASLEEVVRFVEQGKGIMPKFSDILTTTEIREVSEFVLTLE